MFVTTEKFLTKPCWIEFKCSAKCFHKCLQTHFSKVLRIIFRSDTGRLLSYPRLSPFLNTGVPAASFHLIGNFLTLFIFKIFCSSDCHSPTGFVEKNWWETIRPSSSFLNIMVLFFQEDFLSKH